MDNITPVPKTPTKPLNLIILFVAFILLALVSGFLTGQNTARFNLAQTNTVDTSSPQQKQLLNPLFTSQTATLHGKITGVEGNKLNVTTDTSVKGQIQLSERAVIYTYAKGARVSSASSDLKDIKTNLPVTIALELKDKGYEVTSITYLPEFSAKK